jgi:RHH-type proline utilization regulon transcriptional repressor/proline dehydrogenase/delta 1-pyrroline-5-carboxylate dehydrogenase
VERFRRHASAQALPAPSGTVITTAALQAQVDGLDARNWAARPDRVAVLRKALAGSGSIIRKALAETAAFDMTPQTLPGPTGESNRLSFYPKGTVLCLGPTAEIAIAQAAQALGAGCATVIIAAGVSKLVQPLIDAGAPVAAEDGVIEAESLISLQNIEAVAAAGASDWTRDLRIALAQRPGAILSLENQLIAPERYVLERHLCIDTTAAGGNASLLASVD